MPKKNTDSVRQQICNRIAQGQSLRDICTDPSMPSITTVYNWLMPGSNIFNSEFLDQYRVARMWQTEGLAERMIEISRDPNLTPESKKIQLDALKAASAKLEARKYGDDKPRQITVKVVYETKAK
jgi:hypothetical protein